MAQLKKKYVKNDAIDGLKLLLLNNQPLRALNASGTAEDMIKFDENGVMQLLKLPQVPSDPSAENDVVRKSFLDSEIATEVSNRESAITAVETAYQAADSLLSGRLDVVEGDDLTEGSIAKAKKDAQEYADGLISGLINGAPGVLDTLKELSDALGGDENFATTIATQISGLDGRLDVVEGDELTSGSLLNILKQAKDYADSVSGTSGSNLQDAIDAEEAARIAADEALDARLDVVEGDETTVGSIAKALKDAKDYTDSGLAQEISDRQDGDSALSGRLDVIEGSGEGSVAKAQADAQSYADGIVSTEESARIAGDEALDGRLDVLEGDASTVGSVAKAEADAKSYADGLIATEQSVRESADNGLSSRLDVIEGTGEGSVAKAQSDAQTYADGIVATEQTAREAGDTNLQGQIDTEKGRIDAILLAADADKDSFAEIVTLINSIDTENDNAFAAYVLSNDAALAQEVSDRTSGDSALQSEMDATQVGAGLGTDGSYSPHAGSNYIKAADFLAATLDESLHNADKMLDVALKAEVDARVSEGEGFDGRLDVLEGSGAGSVAKAQADAQAYTDSEIAALTSDDIEEGSTNLYFEDGRAQTAAVVNDMTGGETVKAPSVSSVKTYIDALDVELQDQIDDANAAITDLQSDVTDLQAKVFNKEVKTLSATDISNGYVDLGFAIESNSLFVHTNALFLGESEDYSLSVVGGVTRVTWTNGFASGGATAFEEGEKVFFQYRK